MISAALIILLQFSIFQIIPLHPRVLVLEELLSFRIIVSSASNYKSLETILLL